MMAPSNETEADDNDRLPWLETSDDDFQEGPSPLRTGIVVASLLGLIAVAIFGYQMLRRGITADGNGAMIAAQEGDYKVRPDDPGGRKVEGEGDTAIATSNGAADGNASINLKGVPEAPVDGKKVVASASAAAAGTSKAVMAIPPSSGKLAVAPTTAPAVPKGNSGGALVQIGSFPTEAAANAAWSKASGRFNYLASLGKSVQAAQVNGRTTYRLRVNAGSAGQAAELCGKLRVAGEGCFVPKD